MGQKTSLPPFIATAVGFVDKEHNDYIEHWADKLTPCANKMIKPLMRIVCEYVLVDPPTYLQCVSINKGTKFSVQWSTVIKFNFVTELKVDTRRWWYYDHLQITISHGWSTYSCMGSQNMNGNIVYPLLNNNTFIDKLAALLEDGLEYISLYNSHLPIDFLNKKNIARQIAEQAEKQFLKQIVVVGRSVWERLGPHPQKSLVRFTNEMK